MTIEISQALMASGAVILMSLFLTPILLWALTYTWRDTRSL
jgi:hypothetical protein